MYAQPTCIQKKARHHSDQRAVSNNESDGSDSDDIFVQKNRKGEVIRGNSEFVDGKKSTNVEVMVVYDHTNRQRFDKPCVTKIFQSHHAQKREFECLEQKLQLVNGKWTARHPYTGKLLSGTELLKAAKDNVFDWMKVENDRWMVRIDKIQSLGADLTAGLRRKYRAKKGLIYGQPNGIQLIYKNKYKLGFGRRFERSCGMNVPSDGCIMLESHIINKETDVVETRKEKGKYAYFAYGKITEHRLFGCTWTICDDYSVADCADYSVENMEKVISASSGEPSSTAA